MQVAGVGAPAALIVGNEMSAAWSLQRRWLLVRTIVTPLLGCRSSCKDGQAALMSGTSTAGVFNLAYGIRPLFAIVLHVIVDGDRQCDH